LRVIVAPEVAKLPAPLVHQHDAVAHVVQEVLAVAHDNKDAFEALQILLKPHARLQVQVVGGLVQQQQRGRHEKSAREGDAHTPASAEGARWQVHALVREAEAVQDFTGAFLDHFDCKLIQALVHVQAVRKVAAREEWARCARHTYPRAPQRSRPYLLRRSYPAAPANQTLKI
jgi:hypothetical protein